MNYDDLLELAKWGRLSDREIAPVADELRKGDPNSDLYTLLLILGKSFSTQHRDLVERFLTYPEDPMMARLALQILGNFWGDAERYMTEIEEFLKGVPWDEDEDVRQMAISVTGEYLRSHFRPDLLLELIHIFENSEEEQLTREDAYFALARAVGRDWNQLPSAGRHLDLTTQTDPTVLEQAKALIRSRANDHP